MKKRYRRMIDTRRLYRLEQELYYSKAFSSITKQQPLRHLTALAEFIWKKEKMKHRIPTIRFGKGTPHNSIPFSWCDGETIELAKTQRDELTLIHEIVHAMGYDDHDKNFVTKELTLLEKYTTIKQEDLYEEFNKIL